MRTGGADSGTISLRSRVSAGLVTLIVHLPNRGMKFLTKRHTGIIMGWVRASLIPCDVDRFGV